MFATMADVVAIYDAMWQMLLPLWLMLLPFISCLLAGVIANYILFLFCFVFVCFCLFSMATTSANLAIRSAREIQYSQKVTQ